MTTANDDSFRHQLARIEALVDTVERCPDPAAREAARELVRGVLDLHVAGLQQMLGLTGAAGDCGRTLVERFAGDPLVSALLVLHGLHPEPLAQRAARALAKVRPRLHAADADAELLPSDPESIRVRLRGVPAADLQMLVEAALTDAAPDASGIYFEEAWDRPATGRIPLPLGPSGG